MFSFLSCKEWKYFRSRKIFFYGRLLQRRIYLILITATVTSTRLFVWTKLLFVNHQLLNVSINSVQFSYRRMWKRRKIQGNWIKSISPRSSRWNCITRRPSKSFPVRQGAILQKLVLLWNEKEARKKLKGTGCVHNLTRESWEKAPRAVVSRIHISSYR